jgi:hypothetical protein
MFKFGYKFNGKTYAQSKQDGSEANCGVIGFKLFYENEPIVQYIAQTPQWINNPQWVTPSYTTCAVSASWSGGATYTSNAAYTSNVNYCATPNLGNSHMKGISNSMLSNPVRCCGMQADTMEFSVESALGDVQPKGFDMGTEWGRKESSKVNTVDFSRGCLAHSLDIYYASRESLIEMGVPITNQLKVNLPQSFPGRYAEPPKGWVG